MSEDDLDKQGLVSGSSFPELFSLLPNQENDFRRQVQMAGGKIRILIHPFYYWKTEKLQHYFPIIERMLKSESEKSTPILVLEQYPYVDSTKERVMGIVGNKMKSKIFFVSTYEDNPEPYFPESASDTSEATRNYRWQTLNDKLLSFGVQEILLGGQHLVVSSVGNGGVHYDKCVAWAKEAMEPFFNVTLSAVNWPDKPVRR